MNELLVYDEGELDRIGITCNTCKNRETIFQLSDAKLNNGTTFVCPICATELIGMDPQGEYANFTWLMRYKRAKDEKKRCTVKFYFDKRSSLQNSNTSA